MTKSKKKPKKLSTEKNRKQSPKIENNRLSPEMQKIADMFALNIKKAAYGDTTVEDHSEVTPEQLKKRQKKWKLQNRKCDIIGDIHGCAETLIELLKELGYEETKEGWSHIERKAIFLGDFIDRGPLQEKVILIVRKMIENGNALSVMGNHEFNAISYFTPSNDGGYLRERSEEHRKQHKEFLQVYEKDPDKWKEVIDWFKTLPLWLDLGGIRIVHACWDPQYIKEVEELQEGSNYLSDDLLRKANHKGTQEYQAIETLLKGKEIKLPDGKSFQDKDDNTRHETRVRWWDTSAKTYRDAFFGPDSARTYISDVPLPDDYDPTEYSHDEKLVFMGHYWLEGTPMPLADNIACVDYSVAKNGKLVAYRWDGETILFQDKFESVDRLEKNETKSTKKRKKASKENNNTNTSTGKSHPKRSAVGNKIPPHAQKALDAHRKAIGTGPERERGPKK